jgi:hypothetical protein
MENSEEWRLFRLRSLGKMLKLFEPVGLERGAANGLIVAPDETRSGIRENSEDAWFRNSHEFFYSQGTACRTGIFYPMLRTLFLRANSPFVKCRIRLFARISDSNKYAPGPQPFLLAADCFQGVPL